jgi:hypothetical protein
MKRRNSFTLIEILISLSILVSIGVLLATKGYSFLQERQFYASMQRLSDEIYLTKIFSATYQIDIDLHLSKDGDNIILTRITDYAPKKTLNHLFNKKEKYKNISLKDKDLYIHFYGNGFIEVEGTLLFLASSNSELKRKIDLCKSRSLEFFD